MEPPRQATPKPTFLSLRNQQAPFPGSNFIKEADQFHALRSDVAFDERFTKQLFRQLAKLQTLQSGM